MLYRFLPFLALFYAHPLSAKERFFCGIKGNTSTVLCPTVDEITFNSKTQTWSSATGWKSERNTLNTPLKTFIGAQWVGYETGDVVCVYTSSASDAFPITLSAAIITRNPLNMKNSSPLFQQSKWVEKDAKSFQKRLNCLSNRNRPCDCPVNLFIKAKRSTAEILKGIKKVTDGEAVFEYNEN